MLLPLIVAASLAVAAEASEPVVAEAPAFGPGLRLKYQGGVSLVHRDGSLDGADKTFTLTLLVAEAGSPGALVYWLVEEQGQGRWPWAERFGAMRLDAAHRATAGDSTPSLHYDYGSGKSVVAIAPPFVALPPEPAAGKTWEVERVAHEIEKADARAGKDAWRVLVTNSYGRLRRAWVEKNRPIAAAVEQRVFMNQGTEYQLTMELVEETTLAAAEFETERASFAALTAVRDAVGRPRRSEEPDWSAKELAALQGEWPKHRERVKSPLLARVAQAIDADVEQQTRRAGDVAGLMEKYVGQPLPEFKLSTLSGMETASEQFKGKVTVLHFWEYRDQPLEEPYGQVGYLDFLANRRAKDVAVYGVAVDARLGDAAQKPMAVRSVRKLQEFMNLSYPLLLDDGKVLKQLGDPRTLGATLPLFVVLDRDGKIVHYHVGLYEIDRDRGLTELDKIVSDAAK